MEDDREATGEPGAGGGKPKRVPVTSETQAGNMRGFFPPLPLGERAPSALPPPGPKASQRTQSLYRNAPRTVYDPTTPVLVQMVPEISEQAANAELSGRFRGALGMARGMVTGSRPNSSTSGSSIWTSLLGQSSGASPAAKRASRAWGQVNADKTLTELFHDPTPQAAEGPPHHDASALEFKVSTTTLNRLLVWAWAMAGEIQTDNETQANTTARTQFRLLEYRIKDSTSRYADILKQTTGNETPDVPQ